MSQRATGRIVNRGKSAITGKSLSDVVTDEVMLVEGDATKVEIGRPVVSAGRGARLVVGARRWSRVHGDDPGALVAEYGKRVLVRRRGEAIEAAKPVLRPATGNRRAEGGRTTLRLPPALAAAAERVAKRDGISRNDALVRLADLGRHVDERRHELRERRAAIMDALNRRFVSDDHATPAEYDAQATADEMARLALRHDVEDGEA